MDACRAAGSSLSSDGLAGAALSLATTVVAGSRSPSAPPVLEATHLPPLLTAPGERRRPRATTLLRRRGGVDDRSPCTSTGSVFVRPLGAVDPFAGVPLDERSAATGAAAAHVPESPRLPPRASSTTPSCERVAVRDMTLPAGGAAAPHRSVPLGSTVEVDARRARFGRDAARRARRQRGGGRGRRGRTRTRPEPRRRSAASAFDVDADGTVYVLDEANRRVLRWRVGAHSAPHAVPSRSTERSPTCRSRPTGRSTFWSRPRRSDAARPTLRLLWASSSGRRDRRANAAQIRNGPDGAVVLQQPSNQWMPRRRRRRRRSPLKASAGWSLRAPAPSGGEWSCSGEAMRSASRSCRGGVRRSWRDHERHALGRGAARGAARQASRARRARLHRQARTSSRSRPRTPTGSCSGSPSTRRTGPRRRRSGASDSSGNSLYQLGSTPAGAFVDRYDLEAGDVRRALVRASPRRGLPSSAAGSAARTTRGSSRTTATTPRRHRPRTSHVTARPPSRSALASRATSGPAAAGTTTIATTRRTTRPRTLHGRRGRRLLGLHLQGVARVVRTE